MSDFMTRRTRMALMGAGLWSLLAFWSISAFWEHIDELQPAYPLAAKAGALGSEFALLCFLLLHCFDKHIAVRKWSLVFSVILGGLVLIHAGALRGMREATIAQRDTEDRMATALSRMSSEQAAAIQADQTGTQRERLAKARVAVKEKGEVARNAQREVAATIAKSNETVKANSILPKWYLDGWMYSALFLMSILFSSILFGLMMRDDIDANFDGIPDVQRRPIYQRPVAGFSVASLDGSDDPKVTPPNPKLR